jgi:MFS family permease
MRAFVLVWIGQFISLMGTAMTQFGLTIWAYQLTGQATALALVGFFNFAPTVIFSPIAGALVDRWNRKLVMMLSDLGAGAATIFIFIMYASGNLQMWHLYVAGFVTGVFQSFQFPAYSASISLMLKKEDYARAGGMMMLAEAAPAIVAPVLAGFLLGTIDLSGIILIDIITFIVALAALFVVYIPQPPATEAGRQGKGSLLAESAFGFRYIFARPSLLGLQMVFFSVNLIASFTNVLVAPMVLARTNQDETLLGFVVSAIGVGGVIGAAILSAWGGPKRRVHGVLIGNALGSLLGIVLMGVGNSIFIWVTAAFFFSFFIPFINGSNQAIWQAKVAPDVQGRVFAARRLIAQITVPVALLLTGPLADQVFEPAMREGGVWTSAFSWLVGTGPGAGMALMFILFGLIGVMVGFGGYLFPAIRNAEDLLPDHKMDAMPAPANAADTTGEPAPQQAG